MPQGPRTARTSHPKTPGRSWTSAPAPWPASLLNPPTASEVLEVAIFALADERYAVEACHIRKVVRLQELASVPGAVDAVVAVLTPVPCTPKTLGGH